MKLNPSEYELLHLLVTNEGLMVSKQMLLEEVWGPEHVDDTELLKVYIKSLGEMLEKEPGHPLMILDEGETGYRLVGR